MAWFSYMLKTKSGHREAGYMKAHTRQEATHILNNNGHVVLRLKQISSRQKWIRDHLFPNPFDLVAFFKSLSLALSSGFDLIAAIQFSMPRGNSVLCNAVTSSLQKGYSLSTTLKTCGICTQPLLLSQLKAAEDTGRLHDALGNMITTLEDRRTAKKELKQTVLYPLFVLALTMALTSFLLLYVLPNLLSFFAVMGQPIPPETQFLQSCATYFPYALLCIGLFSCMTFAFYLGNKKGILPPAPLLYLLRITASQGKRQGLLCSYYQLLIFKPLSFIYGSHRMDFVNALQMVVTLFPYKTLTGHMHKMVDEITSGHPIAPTLSRYLYLEAGSSDLLHLSEQTGHLTVAFTTIATTLETTLNHTLQSRLKALGPLLLLIVGGILLTLVYTIIIPLYGNLGALA